MKTVVILLFERNGLIMPLASNWCSHRLVSWPLTRSNVDMAFGKLKSLYHDIAKWPQKGKINDSIAMGPWDDRHRGLCICQHSLRMITKKDRRQAELLKHVCDRMLTWRCNDTIQILSCLLKPLGEMTRGLHRKHGSWQDNDGRKVVVRTGKS